MLNKFLLSGVLIIIVGLGLFTVFKNRAQAETVSNIKATAVSDVSNNSSVKVTSSGYLPQILTIKAGGTVTWLNQSGEVVTVSSDDHPTHLLYPPLNLGRINNGGSVSLTFNKPGSYGYHNHLNPSQTGKIVVQ